MAEFCLECWNKINKTNDKSSKYIMSKDLDFCEECNEWKHVIVATRKAYYMRKFRFIVLPVYILWRIFILPYLIYKAVKATKNN